MDNPKDAIGYCAVIIPDFDFWQGYWIVQNDEMNKQAVLMQMNAIMAAGMGASPIGALQSAMVEGAIISEPAVVGAAALALKGMTRDAFFVVMGDREPQGTRTEMFKLKATDIDAAREEIQNLPDVQAIKDRLAAQLVSGVVEGRTRTKGFQ